MIWQIPRKICQSFLFFIYPCRQWHWKNSRLVVLRNVKKNKWGRIKVKNHSSVKSQLWSKLFGKEFSTIYLFFTLRAPYTLNMFQNWFWYNYFSHFSSSRERNSSLITITFLRKLIFHSCNSFLQRLHRKKQSNFSHPCHDFCNALI